MPLFLQSNPNQSWRLKRKLGPKLLFQHLKALKRSRWPSKKAQETKDLHHRKELLRRLLNKIQILQHLKALKRSRWKLKKSQETKDLHHRKELLRRLLNKIQILQVFRGRILFSTDPLKSINRFRMSLSTHLGGYLKASLHQIHLKEDVPILLLTDKLSEICPIPWRNRRDISHTRSNELQQFWRDEFLSLSMELL